MREVRPPWWERLDEVGDVSVEIRATASGTVNQTPQTIAFPWAVEAGDTILLATGLAGTTGVTAVSGAGATWVRAFNSPSPPPGCTLWLGFNPAPGQASIQVTSNAGLGNGGGYVVAVVTDLLPIPADSGLVASGTTPAVQHPADRCLIATASTFVGALTWPPSSWTGATPTRLGWSQSTESRQVVVDMAVVREAGSVTATFTPPSGGATPAVGIVAVPVEPPPGPPLDLVAVPAPRAITAAWQEPA